MTKKGERLQRQALRDWGMVQISVRMFILQGVARHGRERVILSVYVLGAARCSYVEA